jgi:hypothetical protein
MAEIKSSGSNTRKREEGQVVVLFALMLVALAAASALVLDGGQMMARRRQVRNAADAAALAAAYQVADGASDAAVHSTMLTYATNNGATDASGVYLPSGASIGGGSVPGGTTAVRVTVSVPVQFTFASILGMDSTNVGAGASAQLEYTGGGCGDYVIWAHSPSCDYIIDTTGQGCYFDGNVHSNDDLRVAGQGHTFAGRTEYAGDFTVNGSGHTFAYPPVQVPYEPDWPIWFNIQDYRPGGVAAVAAQDDGMYYQHIGDWQVSSSGEIPEGLHYVSGNAKFSTSWQTGRITVVAEGTIQTSGSNSNFETYCDGLLFFANHTSSRCNQVSLDVSGDELILKGILFAPNGMIDDAGSGTMFGAMVGWNVDISGSKHWTYQDEICEPGGTVIRVHLID